MVACCHRVWTSSPAGYWIVDNGKIVDQLREDIPIEVLMIDELSIVETNKGNHILGLETDMMKLVVEIECFGVNFDEFDKETGSSDELQPKQADLNCIHVLKEPYLHEIHVVPNKHEADRLSFISSYACSDSLLLTPLCCDDIHDVTPHVSALAGCDRISKSIRIIERETHMCSCDHKFQLESFV
ncbi:hypothetical protein Tco_0253143 [Tanacetum coccineum]